MSEEIGITASKSDNFSDWYTQVVLKAKLVDYAPVKGLIVLRPDGYSIWESIRTVLDRRFSQRGIRNGFLPTLIPESLLKKEEEHFSGFDPEVFWVTHSGTSKIGDRLALRPTSETLAYSLYAKWIQSWRDLPLKINFWNTALRAEIKGTKPFLRTSEFLWQEGHTVHSTQEEARTEVSEILDIYKRTISEDLAIPTIPGRKSDKEKFVGAVYTTTVESIMPDGKALQMGTSHFLGQNFSKPFQVKFADKDNVEHHTWQTSWGVSWRLVGAMIMIHGDDKGLVLPPRVAPVQAVIIPIAMKEKAAVMAAVDGIRRSLESAGIRIHVDDRDEFTPGYKFNDWELKGVPIRIEIGPRDVVKQRMITVTRYNGSKSEVEFADAGRTITDMLDGIQQQMLNRAEEMLADRTVRIDSYDAFKKAAESGGFLSAYWCNRPECEQKIKDETGAEIRVIPFDEKTGHLQGAGSGSEDPDTCDGGKDAARSNDTVQDAGENAARDADAKGAGKRCIFCNRDASCMPLFARGY